MTMSRGWRTATTAAMLSMTPVLVATVGPPARSDASTTPVSMVAFGDSVPSGARCSCRPFPRRYANAVGAHIGRTVDMSNEAFGGATTYDVLRQLDNATVRAVVRRSRTALVMIGANDFGPAFQRVLAHKALGRKAFPPVAARVQRNVVTIIRRLRAIRPGIRIVVADYWNVMKDGKVGLRDYGAWGESKADQATDYANAALRRAVATTRAIYVSTYTAFKGQRGNVDPTPLLAPDGDHPDSRGHEVIARVFYRAAPNG